MTPSVHVGAAEPRRWRCLAHLLGLLVIAALAACDAGNPTHRCPDLAAPSAVYSTAGAIAALEWAPDGTTLASVVVLPEGAVLQVLDLQTSLWRSPLPGVILQADELPVLGYVRVLSWGGG